MPAGGSAEVRAIDPDCVGARARLAAAQRFAESALTPGLHAEASFILLYDAARNGLTAVLAAAGKRVSEGRGAHAITILEAGRLLGSTERDAIIRIDGARIARNRTEYDAQPVSSLQLEGLRSAAHSILQASRSYVDLHCS